MRRTLGMTLFLPAALATLIAAVPAEAGFVAVKGGVFQPNSKEDGLEGANSGPAVEVSFGGALGPSVVGDVSVGYYSAGGDLNAVPLTFNLRGLMKTLNDRLELTAGGGLGAYYAQTSGGSNTRSGGGVGVHLLAGADVVVAPKLALGAEARWSVTRVSFENTGDHTAIDIGGLTFSAVATHRY